MNISISPELEELINKKVKTGMYSTASEVIREGLRLLKEQDQLKELRLEKLKEEIKKGYDSIVDGHTVEWNPDEFKREVRERVSNAKKSKP